MWLLTVAVTGAFPSSDRVEMLTRALRFAADELAYAAVLEVCFDDAARFGSMDAHMEIVVGGVVVDVDFCANHRHNTGIQRVVRQTMSRWSGSRDIRLVAWTAGGGAMRTMSRLETDRVVSWNRYSEPSEAETPVDPDHFRLVVPYESVVVLPEVPQAQLVNPLAALAQYSGNRIGLIGYDAIPVVSADMVPDEETERFVRYLTIVKHADRVAGISDAASKEFAGFCATLATQGVRGPVTVSVSLPVDSPDAVEKVTGNSDEPSVICVGSQEPRKNQIAVLAAAEVLWREGLSFSLTFIGGGSSGFVRGFDRRIRQLARKGRHVVVRRGVNDAVLSAAYSTARFSVFPSLHEGYGLPVAESLSFGTPSITTEYGSTAEIARGGGCLVVNPRDDVQLAEALRRMIVDDDLIDRLRSQIASRTDETWDDYSSALWEQLVAPLLRSLHDA
ncbi:glycosyltransferase [Rathayibacter sp. YIM 133350]|uniref:glycosyltransferase n=1 Tax=Rathayibacter sp. YIM 133350 TaxID=3131992 RepID=UPI00307CD6F3